MSHRVLQSDVTALSSATDTEVATLKSDIEAKINEFPTVSYQCNDGQDQDGSLTIGVDVMFVEVADCTSFDAWLRDKLTNSSIVDKARIRVHECYHGSDESLPCELGDVWEVSQ